MNMPANKLSSTPGRPIIDQNIASTQLLDRRKNHLAKENIFLAIAAKILLHLRQLITQRRRIFPWR